MNSPHLLTIGHALHTLNPTGWRWHWTGGWCHSHLTGVKTDTKHISTWQLKSIILLSLVTKLGLKLTLAGMLHYNKSQNELIYTECSYIP